MMPIFPPEFLSTYFAILSFLFGACVGSFLNVCIYRIPRDESVVTPRSHCPHCKRLIAWYDNIPLISFFVLRAKCRHCSMRISPRYVLVEALMAVIFFLIWQRFGMDLRTLAYWLMASGLVLGTFVDFEHMIIPDRVSLGGIVAGLLLSPLVPMLHNTTSRTDALIAGVFGAAIGAGALWSVGALGKFIFKKDAMGLGDVKLLGAIGAFCGWEGVLFTIIGSAFVGSLAGVSLIIFADKKWQSRIPYGPYLALAALVWVLGGSTWWNAYITWIMGQPF